MEVVAKQERSQKRIDSIVDAAVQIIESEDINALSLAKVAEISGLKRTSTYKFIPTVNTLKELVIIKCIDECVDCFDNDLNKLDLDVDISKVTNFIVTVIFDFFVNSLVSQKLILGYTINPPLNSKCIHKLGSAIEETYETYIDINDVFNKAGVCRVIAQIILSVFSLNTKESGALNDVGKIEATRAASAYLESWIKK